MPKYIVCKRGHNDFCYYFGLHPKIARENVDNAILRRARRSQVFNHNSVSHLFLLQRGDVSYPSSRYYRADLDKGLVYVINIDRKGDHNLIAAVKLPKGLSKVIELCSEDPFISNLPKILSN